MQRILVIGAGLSASSLIKYLVQLAAKKKWLVTIADSNLELAKKKAGKSKNALAIELDINNNNARRKAIAEADIVASLLPAHLHVTIAKDCLQFKKHLVTASYLSEEMKELHAEALKSNILFLNEIGLDPGIDHLSAMQMIHRIQADGGKIIRFASYCGGLVAPAYDNNPWHYKFTWNPRNVVLAGQATARFLEGGLLKFIPPNRIFTQIQKVKVGGHGVFEAYANRDSLSYIEPYGIASAQTVIRGTLRRTGYCESWNCLIRLGLTDASYQLPNPKTLSYREMVSAFLNVHDLKDTENALAEFLGIRKNSALFKRLVWLGLLEPKAIGLDKASPADALQKLLSEKWKLLPGELDQIVMKHEIDYELKGKLYKEEANLVVEGTDQVHTAMSRTVGLPMGIAVKLILENKIKSRGVQIPITREFYTPILEELEQLGIAFTSR